MDTNTIALLMQMMAQKQAASSVGWSSIVQIVVLILAAIAPTIAALKADSSSKKAMVNSEKAMANTELIHTAVNSERTLLMSDNANLKSKILALSEKIAAFEERQRLQDLKDAATMPVVVAPSLSQADITQIAEKVVKAQA